MPTPEQIAKARSLLSSGNLSPDVAKKLRAAIGEPEPSEQPEPAAVGGETEDATVETPPVEVAETPPAKKRRHMKPQFLDADEPLAPPSKLESAAHGWLNTATLGHADDLAGLLMDGDEDRNVELYREQNAEAEEANPKTHFMSGIAGGTGPAALATYLGAGPTLAGGILGGFQGHGDADDAEGEEMAIRMGMGSAMGAGIGKGLSVAAPYVKKLAGWAGGQAGDFYKLAERLLARGLGATGKQASEAQADGSLANIMRVLREKKVTTGLPATQRQMGDRAEDAANLVDEELAELVNPDDVVIPPRSVSKRILKGRNRYAKGGEGQKYRDRLTDAARDVHRMPQKSVPNPELERSGAPRPQSEYTPPKPKEYEVDFEEVDPMAHKRWNRAAYDDVVDDADEYVDAEPFVEPPRQLPKNSDVAVDDSLDGLLEDVADTDFGRARALEHDNYRANMNNWEGPLPPRDPATGVDEPFPPMPPPPRRGSTAQPVDSSAPPPPPSGKVDGILYGEAVEPPAPGNREVAGTARVLSNERTGIPMSAGLKERRVWGKERNWESDSLGDEVRDVPYSAWNDATEEALYKHGVNGGAWRDLNWNKHALRTAQEWSQQTPVQPPGIVGQVLTPALRALSFGRHNTIGSKLLASPASAAMRGAQNTLAGAGRAMEGAPGAQLAGDAGNMMGRMTAAAMEKSRSDQSRQLKEADDLQRTRSESAGWRQPEVMKQLLKTNPQAFGPYTQQVAAAAQRDEPAAWSALLEKLDRDVIFRTKVQPNLLKLTSGQQQ